MTQDQYRFEVGSKFTVGGEHYVVEAFTGSGALVRSSKGKLIQYHMGCLFNEPSFQVVGFPSSDAQIPIEGVPISAIKAAKTTAAHVLEAITGYKSGTSDDALSTEPRNEYDPDRFNLSQRISHKAAELGKTPRAMWLIKHAYERDGLMGVVDKRVLRQKGMLVDVRIRLKLIEVITGFEKESNPNKKRLKRLTRNGVSESYPDENIPFPSDATFNRLVTLLTKGTQLFSSAKQRRSNSNRPPAPYSHFFANRPGELVLIDSTKLDVFAMDPYRFEWIQVQLTIALDIFTRSLLAWRLTPVSVKGVDAAFLLCDIIRPKWMRPGWNGTMNWAYAGVPESILVELGGDPSTPLPLAALPFLNPESVLVDRGRVFLSDTFMAACRTLGINLLIARPYTPTDKAHVERVFKTIRESFVSSLKGYTGSDIGSRGEDVEDSAFWFIDEIEEMFSEWVGEYYQNHLHKGLELPDVPNLEISPNHMLQEGIARAGFVIAPPDANLFYRLLPTAWRTIQHYGVDIDLRFDGDILNDFRRKKSPYGGKYGGKWPFKYDPRDRSIIYFMDPETGGWHTLNWIGAARPPRPFSAMTLSYAKSLVLSRRLDPNSERDMSEVLNDLLNRIERQQTKSNKERRIAALQVMQTANAAKDRALAPPLLPLAPEVPNADEDDDVLDAEPYPESEAGRRIVEAAEKVVDDAAGDDDFIF